MRGLRDIFPRGNRGGVEEGKNRVDLRAWKTKITLITLIGLFVLVIMAFVSDIRAVGRQFISLPLGVLVLVTVFSLTDYSVRFLRWQILLRPFAFEMDRKSSLITFISGLSLSATPGNLGEAIKALIMEKKSNIPLHTSLPIVFAERLTDGLGILLLALIGAVQFKYGWSALLLILTFFLVTLFLIKRKRAVFALIRFLGKKPRWAKLGESCESFYRAVLMAFDGKILLVCALLSSFCALMQTSSFYYLLLSMAPNVTFLEAMFVLNSTYLVGGISMSPGGVGVVEGGIMALLSAMDVPLNQAATATIISRFFNLWIGVFVGMFALRWVVSHWFLKPDLYPASSARKSL